MPQIINRNLDERESAILGALISEYITVGKPIGSRSFVQKYSFSISPATMRNIMSDLEILGFLTQPHTSAGRTPTDKGYRYYVDTLLNNYDFSVKRSTGLREEVIKKEFQLDKMFSTIARMLGSVSGYAGVLLAPGPDSTVIKKIELIGLNENDVLVIIVSRTGMVITKKVTLSESVLPGNLQECSSYISSELAGYQINDIKNNILHEMYKSTGKKTGNINHALAYDIIQIALNDTEKSDLYFDGIENLFKIPEMVEESRLSSLLKIIDNRELLRSLMIDSQEQEGLMIYIGEEISEDYISGCSIVAASYHAENRKIGSLGIFGPTRMDYEKVVPLVDYTAKVTSDILTKMSK